VKLKAIRGCARKSGAKSLLIGGLPEARNLVKLTVVRKLLAMLG
jgi:hypothetical protein